MTREHDLTPTPRLLTAPEAAKYLSIGVTKLNELRRNGSLQTVRFMSDVRYDVADLDAFIDSNRGWGLSRSWGLA